MPAKARKINLLPQEDFERSGLGHVLLWFLSSFRILVTVTELVVIAAFLSRFWLDAKNNDLDDMIKARSALITADLPFEKQFKAYQERLKVYSNLKLDKNTADTVTKLTSLLPDDVKLTNIQVDGKSVSLDGTSANEYSILQFITNIGADKSFDKPALNRLTSDVNDSSLVDFGIKVNSN